MDEGLSKISDLLKFKEFFIFILGFVEFLVKFSPIKILNFTFLFKKSWNQLDFRPIQKPKVFTFRI